MGQAFHEHARVSLRAAAHHVHFPRSGSRQTRKLSSSCPGLPPSLLSPSRQTIRTSPWRRVLPWVLRLLPRSSLLLSRLPCDAASESLLGAITPPGRSPPARSESVTPLGFCLRVGNRFYWFGHLLARGRSVVPSAQPRGSWVIAPTASRTAGLDAGAARAGSQAEDCVGEFTEFSVAWKLGVSSSCLQRGVCSLFVCLLGSSLLVQYLSPLCLRPLDN